MKNITVQGYDDEDDMIDSTSKRIKLDMPVLSALYNTNHYQTYENGFSADPLMQKDKQLSVEEADHIVKKYAPVFMESVMVMGGYWFYLTGYSVFIHRKSVDDLADKSKYDHQKSAVAFIRRKTQKEADSFECTIRIGYLELMAVSGLYGKCDDQDNGYTAFLGSALQFEEPHQLLMSRQSARE